MKISRIIIATLAITLLSTGALFARAFKSPSFGGTTGLISTPTANTGWEDANIGLDLGFVYISEGGGYYIPKASLQLFGKWEIGAAYDIQDPKDSNDILLHTKFRFYGSGGSALAIGGNFQMLEENGDSENVGQIYLAATYSGNFLSMPAETSLVIGKSFGSPVGDDDIDFSMGFDLDLIPSIFKGYLHWINDFSNYSYSYNAAGANTQRGIFNTGARIAVLRTSKYKFNIDAILCDALDSNREFALGAAFGLAF